MSDGATLRANLPASANLGTDETLLAGADAAGRLLLYAPNPYLQGSSVSHFDTSASPSLLMEPYIGDNLPSGVDATLPLFSDIGWFAGTSGPTTNYLLPSSAHANGKNGAFYTTDLTIANRGMTDANLTLQFLGHDRDGTGGPKQLRALAANRAVTYADILASVFGVAATDAQNFGAILVTADSASLKIVSQTSTPAANGNGTFGQSVPAQSANDFVTPASPKSLVALRDDTAFRTNAFLANPTTSSVDRDPHAARRRRLDVRHDDPDAAPARDDADRQRRHDARRALRHDERGSRRVDGDAGRAGRDVRRGHRQRHERPEDDPPVKVREMNVCKIPPCG